MRILFAVRGDQDFERFVSIAFHLLDHEVTFLILGMPPQKTLHAELLHQVGLAPVSWQAVLDISESAATSPSCDHIGTILDSLSPDLLVVDQFGPACSRGIIDCRDIAMTRGIPTCMIPHGVKTVYAMTASQPPRLDSRPAATVVFYVNQVHRDGSACYYDTPGTWYEILGDPRFDRAHLHRLHDLCSLYSNEEDASPEQIRQRSDGLVRLAYFGSHLEPALVDLLPNDLCCHESNDLNRLMLEALLQFGRYNIRVKSHPKTGAWASSNRPGISFGWLESICLTSWAQVVASPTSSIVIEGLVLGKPAIILNFDGLARGISSIFKNTRSEKITAIGSLSLICVTPDSSDFLNTYCWAGLGPECVARTYAKRLVSVARGDHSALTPVY